MARKSPEQLERSNRRLQGKLDAVQRRCDAYETRFNAERLHVQLLRQALMESLPLALRNGEGIRQAIMQHCGPMTDGMVVLHNGHIIDEQQAMESGIHPASRLADEGPQLRVIAGTRE